MMATEDVDSERIIGAYLKLRRIRAAYVKASDAVIAEFDGKMDRLSAVLLDRMNKHKLKNLSTEAGIAVRQLDIIPTANDWDAFYAWVSETNSFEALERRIKKTFINDYMEENKGGLPPGVTVMRSYKAIVKTQPKKKGLPPDGEE